jgi:sec-independent protein translocase protein TatA
MLSQTFLFLNMGTPEIVLILFAVLLLFGGKKLPELARGLGKGMREFKDASDGVKREIHRNINAINDDLDVTRTSSNTDTESHASGTGINLNKEPQESVPAEPKGTI